MPEYACEPESGLNVQPLEPSGKYIENTFACWRTEEWMGSYMMSSNTYKCCGFLAETSTSAVASLPPPTEDRPISFYLSVVSLVYCVVLTIVFAVWACRQPRLPAVSRRAVPARLPPHAVPARLPPQVVIQGSAL